VVCSGSGLRGSLETEGVACRRTEAVDCSRTVLFGNGRRPLENVYDPVYVSVAVARKAVLLTADDALVRRLEGDRLSRGVVSINSWRKRLLPH